MQSAGQKIFPVFLFAAALLAFSGCISPPECGNGVCEKTSGPPERYDSGTGVTVCPADCAPGCTTVTMSPIVNPVVVF